MEKSYSRPALKRPMRQRFRAFARLVCGLLVLAGSAYVLMWLFGRESAVVFRGIVDAGAENVGPIEAARIVSIEVKPGQRVKAGDVLVRIDPAARLAEAALNEVKIRECEQSALRQRDNLREAERRGRQLVREASVALEERRMEKLREEAELAGLDAEMARLKPLVEKKLVSELEFTALRPKAEALRKTVVGYEPLLKALSERYEQAQVDLKEVQAELAAYDANHSSTNATLAAALLHYEEIQRADTSALKALADGVVSQVFRRQGDIVPAGEAVVRLASAPEQRFVTGMLPAEFVDAVHEGDELVVSRPAMGHSPAVTAKGKVHTIDPEVLDFFDPMNPAPRVPVRGRKVRIRLVDDASIFIPGESVVISKPQAGGFW